MELKTKIHDEYRIVRLKAMQIPIKIKKKGDSE